MQNWIISGYDQNEPVNLDRVVTIKCEQERALGSNSYFIKFVVPGAVDTVWKFAMADDRKDEYDKILKKLKKGT